MTAIPPAKPRPILESDIVNDIRVALVGMRGVWVARNNVGKLKDERGRLVTYGLGIGSPDLIGSIPVNGRARTFAIEVKRPGELPTMAKLDRLGERRERGEKLSSGDQHLLDQWDWIRAAQARGIACGFVDSVAGALEIVELAGRP